MNTFYDIREWLENRMLQLAFEGLDASARAPYEAELAARAGPLVSFSESSVVGLMPWPINLVFSKSRRGNNGKQKGRRPLVCFDVLLDVFACLDAPTLFHLATISRFASSAFLRVIPREPSIRVIPFVKFRDGRLLVRKPENEQLRKRRPWNWWEAVFPLGFARPPDDIECINEVIFEGNSAGDSIFPSFSFSPKFPMSKEIRDFCGWLEGRRSGEYELNLSVEDKFEDPSRPFHYFRELFPLLRGPFNGVKIAVCCGINPQKLAKNLIAIEKFLSDQGTSNPPPEFVRSSPNLEVQIVTRNAELLLAGPDKLELLVDWLFKALPSNFSTTPGGIRRRLLKMTPPETPSFDDEGPILQQLQQPLSAQTLNALYQRILKRMQSSDVSETADPTEFVLSIEGVELDSLPPHFPEFKRIFGRCGCEELLILRDNKIWVNNAQEDDRPIFRLYFWCRPILKKYADEGLSLESNKPGVSVDNANAKMEEGKDPNIAIDVGAIKRQLAEIYLDICDSGRGVSGERTLYLRHLT